MRREHGIGILAIVLHYIEYSVFCKVFCGTSKLSCVGKHRSPCCEPVSRAAGKKCREREEQLCKACALQLYRVTDALQTEAAHKQLAVPMCSQAKRVFKASALKWRLPQAKHGVVCSPAQLPLTLRGSPPEQGIG